MVSVDGKVDVTNMGTHGFFKQLLESSITALPSPDA